MDDRRGRDRRGLRRVTGRAVSSPPSVDSPRLLAAVAVLRDAADPGRAAAFVIDPVSARAVLFHVASAAMATLFGLDGAMRIVAGSALAAVPVAVAAFLHVHGRVAMLGGLSALVALHGGVFRSGPAEILALPLAILSLAAHERRMRGGGRGNSVACAGLALLAVLADRRIGVWLAVVAPLQAIAPRSDSGTLALGSRTVETGIAMLPAVLLCGAWMAPASALSSLGDDGGITFARLARAVFPEAFGVYDDRAGYAIAFAHGSLLLALATLRGREGDRRPNEPWTPETVLFTTIALAAAWRLVLHDGAGDPFAPLAWMLLPILGPLSLRSTSARLVVGAAILASAAYAARIHVVHFRLAEREVAEVASVLRAAEPGRLLAARVLDAGSDSIAMPIFRHAAYAYVARSDGFVVDADLGAAGGPVRVRDADAAMSTRRTEREADYVLVRAPASGHRPEPEHGMRVIARAERWALHGR